MYESLWSPDLADRTEEELDELDDKMRAHFAEVGATIVTARDVARCPKQAWLPGHYYPDGHCRCGERDEAIEALRVAAALKKKAAALHEQAKEWVRCS